MFHSPNIHERHQDSWNRGSVALPTRIQTKTEPLGLVWCNIVIIVIAQNTELTI